MNAQQTALVVRYLHAVCPQQAIDEYTADAWHDVIGNLRFDDCKEAVRNLAREQSFIDTKDIRREVKRIRTRRLDEHGPFDPPDPGMSVAAYLGWLKEARRLVADGGTIPRPELTQRDMSGIDAVRKALSSKEQAS